MMYKLINIAIILLVSSFLTNSPREAGAQEINMKSVSQTDMVRDSTLGISFSKVGKVEKIDSSSYRISFSNVNNGSAISPFGEICASSELFVDLPGSYGGRLYLNNTTEPRLMKNRVYVDAMESNSMKFTREYWTVYAGMGAWDCVINCYTQKAGKYYIVSLVNGMSAGKPGEEVNGRKLTAEELKASLLRTMQDTTNAMVQQFNELLTSFQINN